MQVIIPVAGKGTRLRPHTHTTAKPLLHVAGKPVLQHILDRLEGLPITNIVLITGHLAEQFDDLKTKYPVISVKQEEQLGTAHAIRLAQPHITEDVLIVFADTVFDADMSVIQKSKADGFIWAKEVEDYQRFGVIVKNGEFMQKIVEKPDTPVSRLANIGVYYVRDHEALFKGIDYVFEKDMKVKGEYFLTDALQWLVDNGKKLQVEAVDGWYDCGTWECLIDTNRVLLSQQSKERDFAGTVIIPPVWIEDDVEITNSVIGPNVSVAKGARIENSVVSDSIINLGAKLANVSLKESIVGEGAQVESSPKRVSVGSHSSLTF